MQTYSLDTDALICFHGRLSAEEMTDGPHFKPACLLPSIMKASGLRMESKFSPLPSLIKQEGKGHLLYVPKVDATRTGGRAGDL